MTFFDAVILGVVEGLTEFLPVSSTGHLILTGELLGLPSTEFLKSFDIAIQLGAICAVIASYVRSFFDIEIVKRIAVGFIPTGVIGFLAYPFIKDYLFESPQLVLAALALGGVALILFELWHREDESASPSIAEISYKQAFAVGLFQSMAMVPGVSRSAATILGGLLVGIKRTTIVEYSFLLAVPTMATATGYDMLKSSSSFVRDDFGMLAVGFITSFIVAALAIRFLLAYIRTHTFISFGVYRILIAALFFFVVL